MNRSKNHLVIIVFLTTALLSGCAIVPEPITADEQQAAIDADKQKLSEHMETVTGPITLYEAMARALTKNLDHRVKIMEKSLAEDQSDLAWYGLLPRLSASVGYLGRDNLSASSSRSTETGLQSLVTSTSQDRSRRVYDVSFSWNLLDFGVSYFQAKQEANKVLVAEENRRKTAQNLMQEVRASFWEAASSQLIAEEIERTLEKTRLALNDSRQIEREGLRSPLESLQYQRDLLELTRKLENLAENLKMAKVKLSSMLGLPPGTSFTLALPEQSFSALPSLDLTIAQMEELALRLRPELREELYQKRITAEETHKAIVRLLPGIELGASYNYDSNSYYLNNHWTELSGLITQNLTELISAPARFEQLDAEEKLGETRRLSVHMAVVTQVHLAYQQYMIARHQFLRSQELDQVNQKISSHISRAAQNNAKSELENIHYSTDALMSKLQKFESYALIQSALGKMFVSMGLDLLPSWLETPNLKTLTDSIESIDQRWLSGDFPVLPLDDNAEELAVSEHG